MYSTMEGFFINDPYVSHAIFTYFFTSNTFADASIKSLSRIGSSIRSIYSVVCQTRKYCHNALVVIVLLIKSEKNNGPYLVTYLLLIVLLRTYKYLQN